MILIDAGPLVALINANDKHHQSCREVIESIQEPILTVWPAVTEAMYLLRSSWPAQNALWKMIDRGAIQLEELDETDCSRMCELMGKYRDLPMDLADAALVHVAERERIRRIFTLDRRDFSVYRPMGTRFSILPKAKSS
ncbi:MAG: uncharacterized protein QOE82_3230 [Thermoanaerobaculia bacterium]|jgi:predicted nucleic acid-binding protein|nr:uncharacterized protein [Thermoanaerobaculia bacterium]